MGQISNEREKCPQGILTRARVKLVAQQYFRSARWRRALAVTAACAAAVLAVVVVEPAMPATSRATPVWQKGMTFTHSYGPGNNLLSPISQRSLEYLKSKLHVEWISLNPFGYQHSHDAPGIHFGSDPPDDHLRHTIAEAHRLGIKVMLKPHVWLEQRGDGIWRGSIGMDTEEEWAQWFDDYERFILHYAGVAATAEMDLFCVGVELTRASLEREEDWRRVIALVRQRYGGQLTYAANWWEEYDQIAFWDALDYIGVNAFFPLSQTSAPSLQDLRRNARAVAAEISLVHQRTRKPVLFTEVGFRSVRGSSVRPWEWPRRFEPAIDLEEQSRCYQAVLETFWNEPWFYGMYWWKWFSDLEQGGVRHGGFTPRHKPAEQIGRMVPTSATRSVKAIQRPGN